MNPYASFIGSNDPIQEISETPAKLETLMDRLGPEAANRPWAAGKWTPAQVLSHLVDTEIVFAFRLRQALAQDHHVIQPYGQDDWAETYAQYDVKTGLETFTAVRAWNLLLIKNLPPAALAKPVTHPERGTMTLQTIIETMAGHDGNHLKQLEQALAAPI
jgi:hypothetical protein